MGENGTVRSAAIITIHARYGKIVMSTYHAHVVIEQHDLVIHC